MLINEVFPTESLLVVCASFRRRRTGAITEQIDIRTGFSMVDHAGDAGYYVGYLDTTTSLDFMQASKPGTYAAMGAQPGARLLDVGCRRSSRWAAR